MFKRVGANVETHSLIKFPLFDSVNSSLLLKEFSDKKDIPINVQITFASFPLKLSFAIALLHSKISETTKIEIYFWPSFSGRLNKQTRNMMPQRKEVDIS